MIILGNTSSEEANSNRKLNCSEKCLLVVLFLQKNIIFRKIILLNVYFFRTNYWIKTTMHNFIFDFLALEHEPVYFAEWNWNGLSVKLVIYHTNIKFEKCIMMIFVTRPKSLLTGFTVELYSLVIPFYHSRTSNEKYNLKS